MLKKILFIIENKYKKKIIIFFLLTFLVIIFELLSLGMLIPIVKVILEPNEFRKYIEHLPFNSLISKNDSLIYYVIILFNILILLKGFFLFFAQKYQAKFIATFNQHLTNKIFENYTYQSITSLMKKNLSEINRNTINLPSEFTILLLNSLIVIISDIILLAFVILFLITIEPMVTIMGATIVISVGLIIFTINKKIMSHNGDKYVSYSSKIIKTLNETFGAILEIKSLKKESLFINKFKNSSGNLKDIQVSLSILNFVPKIFFEIISIILISIFFIILNIKFDNINEMLGVIVLFSFAIIKMTPLVNKILINMQKIKFSLPFLDEIYNILSTLRIQKADLLKELKFKDSINLSNINFKYDKSKFILKNINLSIKRNQFFAISGESGSGKSTLLKIVLGLLEPTSGNISVDDQSILLNKNQWQEKISFVPQDVFILDNTLINNITLEIDENKIDFEKLEAAINFSNLRNFIEELPNGHNTILGDKGSKISGGQKQRIGIARAIYSNSEIIIFDESTSSLDEKTEVEIFENIKKLKENKTIIFVTHRKIVKEYCDNFYLLENNILIKNN
jgi:ABC-type bacteriocin/lantibiotic exporter with double-glycine peptidase domain